MFEPIELLRFSEKYMDINRNRYNSWRGLTPSGRYRYDVHNHWTYMLSCKWLPMLIVIRMDYSNGFNDEILQV